MIFFFTSIFDFFFHSGLSIGDLPLTFVSLSSLFHFFNLFPTSIYLLPSASFFLPFLLPSLPSFLCFLPCPSSSPFHHPSCTFFFALFPLLPSSASLLSTTFPLLSSHISFLPSFLYFLLSFLTSFLPSYLPSLFFFISLTYFFGFFLSFLRSSHPSFLVFVHFFFNLLSFTSLPSTI